MPKKSDIVLAEALVERKLVEQKDADSFLSQIDASGESLQQFLIKRKIIPEKEILNILAQKLKLVFLELKGKIIDKAVLGRVPVKIASYYKFIPVEIKGRGLMIAVSSALDIKTQDEIRMQLGLDIEIALACQDEIAESLKKYYGLGADTMEKISTQDFSLSGRLPAQAAHDAVEDIEKLAGDASVIRLVNQIILEGYKKRATDIHIEPFRDGVNLRYRIDGLLYDAPVPTEIKNFTEAIISRIKIMSNLNIVERRLPQDGRAIVKVQEQMLDLRISTIPTPFGESVVVRILPAQMLFSLEKLGLAKRDLQVFEGLIQKPHGIIFVTGPTGSGKTTTLYACLSRISTRERKIITIEDPIEYEMSGVTQIQVQPEIGLTFSRGLRSILRHDPDVIMVGEVRDLETAEIAVRVALTGHLVFSTLHTNDAASGVARLLDIGVEPYLLSSSVEAFIAQRLIRLICPYCKSEDKTVPQELKELIVREMELKTESDVKILRGKGCQNCNFTGFFGRTSIYEILLVNEAIEEAIIKKLPAVQIKRIALLSGMRTLRQDGWQKMLSGLTTPEEVMKVTSMEEDIHDKGARDPGYGPSGINNIRQEHSAVSLPPLDKRVYLRLNSKVNLRYKIFKSYQDLLKRGFTPEQLSVTKSISAGGVTFFSDELLVIGSILELKIELPQEKEPIECLARVVRVEEEQENKYNIAICFLDIGGSQRVRLNKYVENET